MRAPEVLLPALAEPAAPQVPPGSQWDTVVIGAGPGGLTAALYLARFRRRVLLIDAGGSRVSTIPRSRNYPGFPGGIAGSDLLERMHEQVAQHAVPLLQGRVESLTRHDAEFVVGGTLFGEYRARTVLLATGASDIWPDMPAAAQALRDGVLRFCPVCDGFEASDRPVGVLTQGAAGVKEALYLRHFTPKVTVFLCAEDVVLEADELRSLRSADIQVAEAPPCAFALCDEGVAVTHGDQRTVCAALYAALGMQVQSQLASSLDAAMDAARYLKVDARQQTSVPGLYAVGDVASGLNQISVATGGAAVAAAAIHQALRS